MELVKTLKLSDFNGKNIKNKKQKGMIFFGANWCPHCTSFAPTWNEFTNWADSNYPEALIVAIDCAENAEICQRIDIMAYPTIKEIKQNGSLIDIDLEKRDIETLQQILGKIMKQSGGKKSKSKSKKS